MYIIYTYIYIYVYQIFRIPALRIGRAAADLQEFRALWARPVRLHCEVRILPNPRTVHYEPMALAKETSVLREATLLFVEPA